MEPFARLASAATNLLAHPQLSPFVCRPLPIPQFAGLSLPRSKALCPVFEEAGCSTELSKKLEDLHSSAASNLEREIQSSFLDMMTSIAAVTDLESTLRAYEVGLRANLARRWEKEVNQCGERILHELSSARSRYSSPSYSSSTPSILSTFSHPLFPQQAPAEAAGSFTEEVVGILQKAFETKDTLTRAEVKSLAAVTHLNTKQIRTWFANQRQRRGGRKGAAPYNLAITRPSTQRNTTPRRNVSNSSSDSSLISYSESNVSITPPKHNSFFHSPSIELLPPPPQHRKQESLSFPSYVPSHAHEEIDVPMMHYTEPTPITTQFARPPPPRLPLESTHFPLPSPPTTAQTDSFFSLPLPSSHTPLLSYSPTDSSPFPSPPQHHNSTQLSFLDQLQSTDPFLDDQFLQNVFGNLGVTANGGLTLMMDTIEDSEGQGSGKGFSFGW